MAWAMVLAKRSDAQGKAVFGRQAGQAKAIGCSDRQVRRYRQELEDAGLIETRRAPFERRADGTIGRMFTNIYQLVVSVMKRKPSSHRPDTHVRSTSIPKGMDIKPDRRTIIILDEGFEATDFDDAEGFLVGSRPAPTSLTAQPGRVASLRATLSQV